MGIPVIPSENTRSQLAAVEEWKADHEAAMDCYRFEDWIEQGTKVFDNLELDREELEGVVYARSIGDSYELHDYFAFCLCEWLEFSGPSLSDLDKYEKTFGTVRGAELFRDRIFRASRLLETLPRPIMPLTPGLQPWEVTEEEAAQMQALVLANRESPVESNRKLKPMVLGDASLIK